MVKIDKNNIQDIYPLTPVQEGMLFHFLQNPDSNLYVEQLNLEIEGSVDYELFKTVWNTITGTNDILRTVFRWEKIDAPVQILLKHHEPSIVYEDYSAYSNPGEISNEALTLNTNTFKISLSDVPFRIYLFKWNENRYEMIIRHHHILYDGWSTGIIVNEFFKIYHSLCAGENSFELPVKTPFKTFIRWNISRDKEKQKLFWEHYLDGVDILTELPFKRINPKKGQEENRHRPQTTDTLRSSEKGKEQRAKGEVVKTLDEFVRQYQVTHASVFYAAWGILLQRYCNFEDVVFGTTVSGRSAQIKGIENMVGLFINTIPLRVKSTKDSRLVELVSQIKHAQSAREEFESSALVDIRQYSHLESEKELFDSIVVLENYPLDRSLMEDNSPNSLKVRSFEIQESTHYDLTVVIMMGEELEFRFLFNPGTLDSWIVEQIPTHFMNIIETILNHPEWELHRVDFLDEEERRHILFDFNQTEKPCEIDKPVHILIEEEVEKNPDRIALYGVSANDESKYGIYLTYRMMNEMASRLAEEILEKGALPDSVIAVEMERSIEMIVAILGILKTGCIYLPIDINYPQERIEYILKDSFAFMSLTGHTEDTGEKKEVRKLGSWEVRKMETLQHSHAPSLNLQREDSVGATCRSPESGMNTMKMNIRATGRSPLQNTYTLSGEARFQLKTQNPKLKTSSFTGTCYIIYTSGSTGKPKGVMVGHRSLVNLCLWHHEAFNVSSQDHALQYAGCGFDASIWETFPYLTTGAVLHIIEEDKKIDLDYTGNYFLRHQLTLGFLPTQFCQQFIREWNTLPSLRVLLTGGDRLNFISKTNYQLYNNYGPTENTVVTTSCPVNTNLETIPIGKPVRNVFVLILDSDNHVQPAGIPGELCVGGVGIAHGYLNNQELTAERFVSVSEISGLPPAANLFVKRLNQKLLPGSNYGYWKNDNNYTTPNDSRKQQTQITDTDTLYKSGDLARWLPDGNIEFLGRRDFQVKIRGFRIELGEIETQLLLLDWVKEAVVLDRNDLENEKYLCAYIVPKQDLIHEEEIKRCLSLTLPAYMVPSYFVRVERIPLTSSGKVDRKALPEPMGISNRVYIAPRNEIEQALANTWKEILGIERSIGIDDNFFELGGHSIKAASLVSRIHKVFDVRIPMAQVFNLRTIRELANYLNKITEKEYYSPIEKIEERQYYDLSNSQARIWMMCQIEGVSQSYNIPGAYFIRGDLNIPLFEDVFKQLICRHESLRTVFFSIDGVPKQQILEPEACPFVFEKGDFSLQGEAETGLAITKMLEHEMEYRFNLEKGPLLCTKLIRLESRRFLFLLTMHHIISDGVSMDILLDEIVAMYTALKEGKTPALHPLRVQYKDIASWMNREMEREVFQQHKEFWLKQLGGVLPRLDLPVDRQRPKTMTFSGATIPFIFDETLTKGMRNLGTRNDASLFMVLIALLNATLSRLTNQTDIIVGTPVAGRKHEDMENQVGVYIDTLVLRTVLDPVESFEALLRRVKEMCLGFYKHQDYPFDKLVEDLGTKRDSSRNPVFDILVDMIDMKGIEKKLSMPGLTITPYDHVPHKTKFDLTIFFYEYANRVKVEFEYNTDLFDYETVEYIGECFKRIAERLTFTPQTIISRVEIDDEPVLICTKNTAIQDEEGKQDMEASYHQERLWFIDRFEAGNLYQSSPVYHNIPIILEWNGPLDMEVLKRSFEKVLERHDILRTRIETVNDFPKPRIYDSIHFALEFEDINGNNNDSQETWNPDKLESHLLEDARSPFKIDKDLLSRAKVFRISQQSFILSIVVHHIIADYFSLDIIVKELFRFYETLIKTGSTDRIELPVLPFRYVDIAHAQRYLFEKGGSLSCCEPHPETMKINGTDSGVQQDALHFYDSQEIGKKKQLMMYWKKQLGGRLQPLEVATDRPRAMVHIYKDAGVRYSFPAELTKHIKESAKSLEVPVFAYLLAAFKILLYRYSGLEEIIVGTSAKNRSTPGSEGIVGPLANLVTLRTHLSGDWPFTRLVNIIASTLSDAYHYQAMPFDKLVMELNPEKDMSRTALFDVLFQYQTEPFLSSLNDSHIIDIEGVSIRRIETNRGWGKYDWNLLVQDEGENFSGVLVYNELYYDEWRMKRLWDHFCVILENVVQNPSQQISFVEILTPEEKKQLLEDWSGELADVDYPRDVTVHELFERQVQRTPFAVAVSGLSLQKEVVRITYTDLDNAAETLAHELIEKGVKPGDIAAVSIDRCVEMIVAILGILKSGGAYLPIDPFSPQDRIDYILKDSNAALVLTTDEHRWAQINKSFWSNLFTKRLVAEGISQTQTQITDTDTCYIIYTSGTTGRPKGVLIEHRNVVRLFFNDRFQFRFSSSDVWTMFHNYFFDFSVWEMYGALLFGGRVVIIPKMTAVDTSEYLKVLKREGVTVLNQTPSAFYRLMELELKETSKHLYLRYIVFGGEELNPAKLKEWYLKYSETHLINMYGITETTVHVTFKEITLAEIEAGISNIGKPIPTLRVFVLDRYMQPVPVGAVGEMVVGGAGVARGYLNRPELTSERFVSFQNLSVLSDSFGLLKKTFGGRHGDLPLQKGQAFDNGDDNNKKTNNRIITPIKSSLPTFFQESRYKSGDLARYLGNGELQYLGRMDFQVKIRGNRVELGEIERQALCVEGVREVVVIARKDSESNNYLCAYLKSDVPFQRRDFVVGELRKELQKQLPQYMIPSYFIVLDEFPVTSTGKLDRASLPEPEGLRTGTGVEYVEPGTDMARGIAAVWRELLKLDRVGMNDNFFDLGGNSMALVRLKNRLSELLSIEIPVAVLFEYPTIRDFVKYLDSIKKVEAEPMHVTASDIGEKLQKGRDKMKDRRQRLK